MVVIERKLWGLLSYKTVFFAPAALLRQIAERLRPTEITRFYYTSSRLDDAHRLIKIERTFTVCNNLLDPLAELWQRFAPYNRVEIRKAEKLFDRIRIGCNEPEGIKDFLTVYNDFARLKDGVRPISAHHLERHGQFADRLVLYLDEQPMVVNLVLRDSENGRVSGLLSASRRLDEPKKARLVGNLDRLLHWNNMRLYKQRGFNSYDWGGISADRRDGRTKFKTSFGGEIKEEYTYLCVGWPYVGFMIKRLLEVASTHGLLRSR